MDSKRILLLEQDRIQASAIGALILQCGHLVVGPAHSMEEALNCAQEGAVDLAILQLELNDGTDATPVVEVLCEQQTPYAVVVQPGDAIGEVNFPNAIYMRKPLSLPAIKSAVEQMLQQAEVASGVRFVGSRPLLDKS
jgi:DNA-binding response OmpR family regulator